MLKGLRYARELPRDTKSGCYRGMPNELRDLTWAGSIDGETERARAENLAKEVMQARLMQGMEETMDT